MSKAIDFFEQLDKTEKAMATRTINGIECFYCELEKCWITPFACIKRQKKEIKFRKAAGFETFETKCDQCRQAKEIQKITGIKVKKNTPAKRKSCKLKREFIPKKMICAVCKRELDYNKKNFSCDFLGVPSGFICLKCRKRKEQERSILNY